MYQSVITPEGDKPWMDLPREGAYLRRIREAVPGAKAVCKMGRHAHYNVFISIKKMAEGDPGRVAAAALTFDHTKNVFVFDEDIDVYNPTDILWALATRVQPHLQISNVHRLAHTFFSARSIVRSRQFRSVRMMRWNGSSWRTLFLGRSCSTFRPTGRPIGVDLVGR